MPECRMPAQDRQRALQRVTGLHRPSRGLAQESQPGLRCRAWSWEGRNTVTTASGGTVFLLSVGGNHLRSYINICTFSFHLFQKPRPVKIGSGLNVRSPFQGGNLWKPQNVEKGGTGEHTGHSSTGGWRLHPTGVGTAPGKSHAEKPWAPHRCGQHP